MPRKASFSRLTLNPSGYWCITYRGPGKKPGTTREYVDSTGTKDALEAEEIHAKWVIERRKPVAPAPVADSPEAIAKAQAAVTVKDCWERYRSEHLENDLPGAEKVRTADEIKRLWDNYMSEFFGEMTIAEVGQKAINLYTKVHTNGSKRSVKPHSVRKELEHLRAIIKWGAKKPGALFSLDLIQPFELPKAGKRRQKYLTDEEIEKLLATAAARRGPDGKLTRVERALWLGIYAGARLKAMCELPWIRVDFINRQIYFPSEDGDDPKNKGRGIVPISDQLLPVLQRAYEERTSEFVIGPGGLWDSIQRVVYAAGLAKPGYVPPQGKEKAKATGIYPHALRHTTATHMASKQVPIWEIANILGNSPKVVQEVYAHWYNQKPDRNVNLIGGDIKLID